MVKSSIVLTALCSSVVLAAPTVGRRQDSATPASASASTSNPSYYIPQNDPNISQRNSQISANRQGYLYGPPLIGDTSFFPSGNLGGALVQSDIGLFRQDAKTIQEASESEANSSAIATAMVNLHSI